MPGGVVMSYAVFGFFAAIIYVLALEPDTRVALAVTPVWFAALGVAYRVLLRRRRRAAAVEGAAIEEIPAER
jgi:D-serine/D-alanine/glycine transporter